MALRPGKTNRRVCWSRRSLLPRVVDVDGRERPAVPPKFVKEHALEKLLRHHAIGAVRTRQIEAEPQAAVTLVETDDRDVRAVRMDQAAQGLDARKNVALPDIHVT